ncbi:hypothetical protein M422DRAFT_24996 [Sphaerobolus stellatus SS14]|nr:hypothetical protein M422DRAFT_24996 [Sphaerobolus stellatus SS14]
MEYPQYMYTQPLTQLGELPTSSRSATSFTHPTVQTAANFLPLHPSHKAWTSSYGAPYNKPASRVVPPERRDSPEDTPSPNSATSSLSNSGQHAWVQTAPVTTSKALNHLVCEFSNNGIKTFFCGWTGCKHPVGFTQKPQLITHIRSAHLQEKPFMCSTCKVQFSRKQEASRHVLSMNSGRKYKCSACHQAFSRKNYRDTHEEACMFSEESELSPKLSNLSAPHSHPSEPYLNY